MPGVATDDFCIFQKTLIPIRQLAPDRRSFSLFAAHDKFLDRYHVRSDTPALCERLPHTICTYLQGILIPDTCDTAVASAEMDWLSRRRGVRPRGPHGYRSRPGRHGGMVPSSLR